ncbi:methyltransferase family protein [Roseobacter sp. A03A-229]
MKRIFIFAYGVIAYILFLAVFAYMAGFLLSFLVPKGINTQTTAEVSLLHAIIVNLGLIGLFGFLHSLLARERVKTQLLKLLPAAAERSTYVVQSSLCLALAMWQWQPLPGVIWQLEGPAALATYAAFGIGAGLVLWSTFLIDHFELFGLRQIWTHLRGQPMPEPVFRTPMLYRIVRHPMQLGIVILLFATPQMTWGHLLFAGAMTAYIFVGLYFEERALLRLFGERYAAYQKAVPMLIPGLRIGPRLAAM